MHPLIISLSGEMELWFGLSLVFSQSDQKFDIEMQHLADGNISLRKLG